MNTKKFATSLTALAFAGFSHSSHAFDLLPLGSVKQIQTGYAHSCALLDTGIVKCWGANNLGQLGDGTSTPRRAIASAVVGLSDVKQIAVGENHTCALLNDGYSKCWGAADSGQLGAVTHGEAFFNVPQPVVQSVPYIAISTGWNTTCALDNTGSASPWCWGKNEAGQIGDGTNTNRKFPRMVITGGVSDSAVTVGYGQVCVIQNYALQCWGSGYFGAPNFENNVSSSGIVGMPNDAIAVSAGAAFLCALQGDGSLWCLGANDNGQIGDNSITTRKSPVQVSVGSPMTDVESVAAGSSHTCAVLTGEYARCWGANFHGQLGIGSRTEMHLPTTVSLSSVESISASKGQHTCAMTHTRQAYCWGNNDTGQVGSGGYGSDVLSPAPVLDDDRVFADGFEPPNIGPL